MVDASVRVCLRSFANFPRASNNKPSYDCTRGLNVLPTVGDAVLFYNLRVPPPLSSHARTPARPHARTQDGSVAHFSVLTVVSPPTRYGQSLLSLLSALALALDLTRSVAARVQPNGHMKFGAVDEYVKIRPKSELQPLSTPRVA